MRESTSSSPASPGPDSGRLRGAARHAGLLLVLGIAVWSGLRGVDFGEHWDEVKLLHHAIKRRVERGGLLPGFYYYGSVVYNLAYLSLAPDVYAFYQVDWTSLPADHRRLSMLRGHLGEAYRSDAFRLRVRSVFVVVSLLSVVWTYLAVFVWTRRARDALFAAAFLGLSWEVGYHARWIAPDAVVMQFGALTLLCLVLARRSAHGRSWCLAAAAGAGLATASKYPGGLLLAPVLVATWLEARERGAARPACGKALGATALVFGLTFVIAMPGAILEPLRFVDHVLYSASHYAGSHCGHTVAPGWPHLGHLLRYLAVSLPSPFAPFALLLAALIPIGAWAAWREDRRTAAVLLCFPLLYLIYFSSQRVMLVRNLLVMAPFLAVLAAYGLRLLAEWLGAWRPPLLRGLAAALLLGFGANAAWLVKAGDAIHRGLPEEPFSGLLRYVDEHPTTHFAPSPATRRSLAEIGALDRPNLVAAAEVARSDHPALGVARWSDLAEWGEVDLCLLAANRPGRNVWPDPTYEVNRDYYPTFPVDRIVIVPSEVAREMRSFGAPGGGRGARDSAAVGVAPD